MFLFGVSFSRSTASRNGPRRSRGWLPLANLVAVLRDLTLGHLSTGTGLHMAVLIAMALVLFPIR